MSGGTTDRQPRPTCIRHRRGAIRARMALLPVPLVLLSGCATLRQLAALRQVDFALDRVADIDLAGVRIDPQRSFADLALSDAARIAAAVAARDVPLSFIAHVEAHNPDANAVSARLLQMRWTAYIEDRATVSGGLDREYLLPPGEPVDVPLRVEMDLYDFSGGRASDLFRLARAVAGVGAPTNVSLKAKPIIQTPLGPVAYPNEITVLDRRLGTPGTDSGR